MSIIYAKKVVVPSLLLCIFVHAIWGLQPTACRYLLVFAEVSFNGQAVIAFARLTSLITICVHDAISDCCSAPPEIEEKFDRVFLNTSTSTTLTLFGTLSAFRAMLNMASCYYTTSYNIATVNLLSPIITPFADKVILGADLPRVLWYCVGWTSLGCFLMIYGEGEEDGEAQESVSDFIGVTMQLVSVLLSVVVRLMMKTSQGIATKSQLMHVANGATVILGTSFSVQMTGWQGMRQVLAAFSKFDSATIAILWLSLGVYTVGSYLQIKLCRNLGPGIYASFSAIRIVTAVISSSYFLNEAIQNVSIWLGLGVISGTVTWYTARLLWWAEDKQKEIKRILTNESPHSVYPQTYSNVVKDLNSFNDDDTSSTLSDVIYSDVVNRKPQYVAYDKKKQYTVI